MTSARALPYQRGLTVPIGRQTQVEIPARVFRALLRGVLFESEKTFVLPSVIPGLGRLKRFYDRHPGREVLVVGHTDAEGPADYNWALSCDRAEAVASYLRDDVDGWLRFYRPLAYGARSWGVREDQYMLGATADDRGPFFAGAVTGQLDAASQAALRRFQEHAGLRATGAPDAETRRALVTRYQARDGTTLPTGTRIATHGCGEWHPVVATPDGVGNQQNRRVEIFLFEDGVVPPPPPRCPYGGCREYPQWRERVVKTIDLLADPPESDDLATIRILQQRDDRPCANLRVLVRHPDGSQQFHETDAAGEIQLPGDPAQAFQLLGIESAPGGPLVRFKTRAKG